MQETCQLLFRTSQGKNRLVTVKEPRDGINLTAVNSAASMMMTANPFDAETGHLVSLVRVQVVTVTRQAIIEEPAAA
jgi:hypothetical protein